MKAGTKTMVALAAVLACTAIAAIPAGASGGGSASKSSCRISDEEYRHLGASYTYSLKARNLDCGKAKKLVMKLHECRHDRGGYDGSCAGFKGYSCKQKAGDSSPGQFNAKAKCEKGSKKFVTEFGELA